MACLEGGGRREALRCACCVLQLLGRCHKLVAPSRGSGHSKSRATIPGPAPSGGSGGGIPPASSSVWGPRRPSCLCLHPHVTVFTRVCAHTSPWSQPTPTQGVLISAGSLSAVALFPHEATLTGPRSGPELVCRGHHVAPSAPLLHPLSSRRDATVTLCAEWGPTHGEGGEPPCTLGAPSSWGAVGMWSPRGACGVTGGWAGL